MDNLIPERRNMTEREENGIRIRVWEQTLKNGKKEYIETVTEQVGLQEMEIDGKRQLVDRCMTFESKLGTSHCYSIARPGPVNEEERQRNRKRVQALAAEILTRHNAW